MGMDRSLLYYVAVLLLVFNVNVARAEITTSYGSWNLLSKLSTAAGSRVATPFSSISGSTRNVTRSSVASNCSTAYIHGTLAVQKACHHVPSTNGSSMYTVFRQLTKSTTSSNQVTLAAKPTNASEEPTTLMTKQSSAVVSDIPEAVQISPSATPAGSITLGVALTQLHSTYSRPSLLPIVSSVSFNQRNGSSGMVPFSGGSSTKSISVASNSLPASLVGDQAKSIMTGSGTTSFLTVPTSATSSGALNFINSANVTLTSASLAAETNKLQGQLIAIITLTQAWLMSPQKVTLIMQSMQ